MSDTLKQRIINLNSAKASGECVLYVMSRDQRVHCNHALLAAQKHALAQNLPLAVVFCLYARTGYRAKEQYEFMIGGLRSLEQHLTEYNIPFMMLIGKPHETLSALFGHAKPSAVYFDFSPLRGPMRLQQTLANKHDIAMFQVDTHNVVPTRVVSGKMEVGAYTIRPKIHKLLAEFLVEPEPVVAHPHPWPGRVQMLDELQPYINAVLSELPSNGTHIERVPGELEAREQLADFISTKLERYAVDRNDPASGSQSDLSPYLHFGQISALQVALRLRDEAVGNGADLHFLSSPKMPKPEDAETTRQHGIDSLIEEMIVRKELADNYCLYNPQYDSLDAAPGWAKTSLDKHARDPREFIYSYEQLERAETHDPAWNAAQKQLTRIGKMHGYMRMYWAKKVLEWTESPSQAIDFLIKLNDFYSIDGGDPNGYAGILWSVGGVHDRPWAERDVFGVIRYMNYGGLKRKFDITAYEKQWSD